jgi:hypothetical protein
MFFDRFGQMFRFLVAKLVHKASFALVLTLMDDVVEALAYGYL